LINKPPGEKIFRIIGLLFITLLIIFFTVSVG
jgi:hypothetical protein